MTAAVHGGGAVQRAGPLAGDAPAHRHYRGRAAGGRQHQVRVAWRVLAVAYAKKIYRKLRSGGETASGRRYSACPAHSFPFCVSRFVICNNLLPQRLLSVQVRQHPRPAGLPWRRRRRGAAGHAPADPWAARGAAGGPDRPAEALPYRGASLLTSVFRVHSGFLEGAGLVSYYRDAS